MTGKNQYQRRLPNRALSFLDVFVGKWKTVGSMNAGPFAAALELKGTATIEWVRGKFLLLHRVKAQLADEACERIELIGYDQRNRLYRVQYFDSQGNSGTMKATLQQGVWSAQNKYLRIRARLNDARDRLAGTWEQSMDGESWMHVMDIQMSRMTE